MQLLSSKKRVYGMNLITNIYLAVPLPSKSVFAYRHMSGGWSQLAVISTVFVSPIAYSWQTTSSLAHVLPGSSSNMPIGRINGLIVTG